MNDTLRRLSEIVNGRHNTEESVIEFNDKERFFRLLPNGEPINYSSVDTPKKLLECVYMFSEKPWITREHICYMIRGLSGRLGLDLDVFVD